VKASASVKSDGSTQALVECDVLVIGAGAGGLTAAITAAKAGLKVIIAEKEPVFGGTTAFSGGVLWIPGNEHSKAAGIKDTREAAREYLKNECGDLFDDGAVDVFLENAPRMVEWLERETCVKFIPTLYPDYHPTVPGGTDIGRSILAAPFDIRGLGADVRRMRQPLWSITFVGMMFNSSNADLKHFFRATKSLKSFAYVVKRICNHLLELLIYRRAIKVTSGNALAARLAKATMDLGVPIWTCAPAIRLTTTPGAVRGAVILRNGVEAEVIGRHGVVLACGGFSNDLARIRQAYPHLKRGGNHFSPVPSGNTGDGIRLAETVGAQFDLRFPSPAAWMPVSKVPRSDGSFEAFPHLLDRYKPGVIGVTRKGVRFCNESDSYHDVGAAMIEACKLERETAMWLVCDHAALSKYGLGYVKPTPVPIGRHIRTGYLLKGNTLSELAARAGIESAALKQTVREYNIGAAIGQDRQFGRGGTSFNRYLADPEQKPNPCVAPIVKAPFYAVKLFMGDLGTFDGLRTTVAGQVMSTQNAPIDRLYAVGNDRASLMCGRYPAAGITLGPIMTFAYVAALQIVHRAAGGAGLPE
jgi:succinate dehydrogenase/fumarate reductase flavoprotein subunit